MIGFEEYIPEKWQAEGLMTIHVPERSVKAMRKAKREVGALGMILRASIVGLGISVSSLTVSENDIAVGTSTVLQRTSDIAAMDGSEVPDGYWERLLTRLKSARPLSEDSLSDDPEPLA